MQDAETYCGYWGSIAEKTSLSTKMTISFSLGLLPLGSRFHCEMKAVVDSCVCGRRNNGKIVGGDETIVNEFPSMAGLIDRVEGIICGATISKAGFYNSLRRLRQTYYSFQIGSRFSGSLLQ